MKIVWSWGRDGIWKLHVKDSDSDGSATYLQCVDERPFVGREGQNAHFSCGRRSATAGHRPLFLLLFLISSFLFLIPLFHFLLFLSASFPSPCLWLGSLGSRAIDVVNRAGNSVQRWLDGVTCYILGFGSRFPTLVSLFAIAFPSCR